MKRRVLFVPNSELREHFRKNARQDIKVVTPNIMTQALAAKLRARGKEVKEEVPFEEICWTHSSAEEPNRICHSRDFMEESVKSSASGPIAVSFASAGSVETFHYHREHWEVYFSEYKLGAEYRLAEKGKVERRVLDDGGAIVFGPDVTHRMQIHGLTIILEIPAVAGDREAPQVQ